MKKNIVGCRRFSKIEQTEIQSREELKNYFKEHGRTQLGATFKIGHDFLDRADLLEKNAKAVLRKSELPDEMVIDNDTGWTLINFFVKEKGYEHDSEVGIAADILVCVSQIKSARTEELRLAGAFRLGELRTYAKVYGMESLTQSLNAKLPRKNKSLTNLANYLAAQYAKFPDAWRSIPESDINDDDIFRQGDVLICHDSFGKCEINRESFRTGYFVLAKKGNL
jgi:hypothetical protein